MPGVKNTYNIALIAISAPSTITYSFAEVKAQGKGYFFRNHVTKQRRIFIQLKAI